MAKNASGTATVSRPGGRDAAYALTIRSATVTDVPVITEIFNQGVEDKIATFDAAHTVTQRQAWFATHGTTEPVIVTESSGQVVGWASLSQFSQRSCFDLVKELSIYVRREWRNKGVGDVLMADLLQRGAEARLHKVILFVFPSNLRGIALYKKNGFTKVGIFRNHGFRDGEWLDSMAMERIIDSNGR
ncbi:MAG: N-acetyltransferase family protein [Dehalococcoidia bacterium]|nr:N-acetyltransferase family protein [Dehalococcoidia bacterium]